jgi:bisphosphoglycerate-independent phosphoglycerate mutase (AlkP superfamily)
MDRDKRWERVKIAVDGLVKGVGEKAEDVVKAIEEKYKADETDEFLKPLIVNGDAGRIKGQFEWASCSALLSDFFTLRRWRYSVLLQLSF